MSDFWKSFEPVPYRVLRTELRPLSLGAIIALHLIESPFVCSTLPTITSLMASVFVCSRPFVEAMEGVKSPEFPKFVQKWAKKIGPFNFDKTVELFASYVKEGRQRPTYDYDAHGTFTIDAPGEEVVLNYLLANTNLTEVEILDRPFVRTVRNFIILKAMKGEVRLMRDDAIANAIKVGEQAAKAFAEREAQNVGA